MAVNKKIVIAIDGHSSCGKSTFAKAIAAKLGYTFVDSGAMYRAATLYAMRKGVEKERERIVELLPKIDIRFKFNSEKGRSDIYLGTENVEDAIRSLEVSNSVSFVSAIPQLRAKLCALQAQMGVEKGIVMDGRDIGTTVFPNAELKIFMTASVDVRAKRRYDELRAKGDDVSLEQIKENISQRDFTDENRSESPLRKADDAIVLDNSSMSVAEQMQWVEKLIESRTC
ncbi:MAG: (d)CMP kinase [Rikenellaceae bacterium]